MFLKIVFSLKVSKIQAKYLWRKSVFSKVAGCRSPTLLKWTTSQIFFKDFANIISSLLSKLLRFRNNYFHRTILAASNDWPFIAAPQGGFIAPHVWEIAGRKNLAIFKGCHYSWFYMMISWSFQKIETKNLNSEPCILNFLVLGTKSPAAYWLSKH